MTLLELKIKDSRFSVLLYFKGKIHPIISNVFLSAWCFGLSFIKTDYVMKCNVKLNSYRKARVGLPVPEQCGRAGLVEALQPLRAGIVIYAQAEP